MYLDYFLYSVFVELYGDPRRLGAPPGEAGHTNDLANQGTVRASPTNDPDLPVRRVCRDLPPGLVGGGSWKSDDGVRRKSDGVVSSQEREFAYLDYFMYGLSTQIFLYGRLC